MPHLHRCPPLLLCRTRRTYHARKALNDGKGDAVITALDYRPVRGELGRPRMPFLLTHARPA